MFDRYTLPSNTIQLLLLTFYFSCLFDLKICCCCYCRCCSCCSCSVLVVVVHVILVVVVVVVVVKKHSFWFSVFFSFDLLSAQRIGCFRDTSRRAIPQLDGRNRLLRGNYQRRKFAIQKCLLVAAKYGYKMFGVQNGGWCASGPHAYRTYAKYGRSNRCRGGKGGPWANDVYRISGQRCINPW